MAIKLSSIDYLTSTDSPSGNVPSPNFGSVDSVVERAASVFGGQILAELRKAPGTPMPSFDLVDSTSMNIQTLHQVLDVIQSRYGWVEVDRTDPKGNYLVRLTDQGMKYLDGLRTALR